MLANMTHSDLLLSLLLPWIPWLVLFSIVLLVIVGRYRREQRAMQSRITSLEAKLGTLIEKPQGPHQKP